MVSLYPKLDRLVAGRDVILVGGAADDSTIPLPEDAVTIRFNGDRKPAEVFVSTFPVDCEPLAGLRPRPLRRSERCARRLS